MPIETGEVDQQDPIDRAAPEDFFRFICQRKKLSEFRDNLEEPDDCHSGQVMLYPATLFLHRRATKTSKAKR
jgi:hypothetical protein